MSSVKERLLNRFMRYAAIPSQSNACSNKLPSSEGQLVLARQLARELHDLGLNDVRQSENAIVTACIKGNSSTAPAIGFVAHLDTVDVGLSPVVRPQVIPFRGADILLNKEKNIQFKISEHPEIHAYLHEEIIFSDGTSVLGADNKAAIAVIMTVIEDLLNGDRDHGDIHIAFVPDEEIGLRGAKKLNLEQFSADFAFTIDCCGLGEVVYETFNAGSAHIEITGVTAHPMSAKGVLINPIRVAQDFMSLFDVNDTPEHTDGREGYFWFTDMVADPSRAELKMNIRDFDRDSYDNRKAFLDESIQLIRSRYPGAVIDYSVEDVYSNIADALVNGRKPIELIYSGMHNLGIEPKAIAMRGGTDGSALSAMGLVTPNYFTGAHNFHSKYEFLPISSFIKSYELTREIIKLANNQ